MTTKEKRTYLVVDKSNGVGRLIKTISINRAVDHVIGDRFLTRVASQDDLILALQAGVKVEELSDAPKGTAPAVVALVPPNPARRAEDQQGSVQTGIAGEVNSAANAAIAAAAASSTQGVA